MITETNYEEIINKVTKKRFVEFVLIKLIFVTLSYFFFIKFTQSNLNFISNLEFYYSKNILMKIILFTLALDYFKFLVYKNYEMYYSKLNFFTNIFLIPSSKTAFLFFNSVLICLLIYILQGDLVNDFNDERK